ncbi:MAG: pentapeptide repeat-containing protein [Pirellulales bacterium]
MSASDDNNALKIVPPDLAGEASFASFCAGPLEPGRCYGRIAVGQLDLAGSRAADLRFEEATFTGTMARGAVWQALRLIDVRLRGCDFSNADLRQASVHRGTFESCNLTGINLAQAQLHHVRFERSKLVLAQFAQAKFVAAEFHNCQLEQADFADADLRGVVFAGCNLRRARLFGAKLEGADLRGSDLSELGATPFELKGAIVDAGQLLQLAPLLGVVVK